MSSAARPESVRKEEETSGCAPREKTTLPPSAVGSPDSSEPNLPKPAAVLPNRTTTEPAVKGGGEPNQRIAAAPREPRFQPLRVPGAWARWGSGMAWPGKRGVSTSAKVWSCATHAQKTNQSKESVHLKKGAGWPGTGRFRRQCLTTGPAAGVRLACPCHPAAAAHGRRAARSAPCW